MKHLYIILTLIVLAGCNSQHQQAARTPSPPKRLTPLDPVPLETPGKETPGNAYYHEAEAQTVPVAVGPTYKAYAHGRIVQGNRQMKEAGVIYRMEDSGGWVMQPGVQLAVGPQPLSGITPAITPADLAGEIAQQRRLQDDILRTLANIRSETDLSREDREILANVVEEVHRRNEILTETVKKLGAENGQLKGQLEEINQRMQKIEEFWAK